MSHQNIRGYVRKGVAPTPLTTLVVSLVISLCFFAVGVADAQNYLTLEENGVAHHSHLLSVTRSLTFGDGSQIVVNNINGNSTAYAMSQITRIYFSDSPYLGGDAATYISAAASYTADGCGLSVFPTVTRNYIYPVFSGQNGNAKVINLKGEALMSRTVTSGERIDVSALPKGVFILTVGHKSVRFMKL